MVNVFEYLYIVRRIDMSDEKELKTLELRIAKLETLVSKSVQREVSDITADELRAYQKVKDLVAVDWGGPCGINECYPCVLFPCTRCYIDPPKPCDVECTCGPCALGGVYGLSAQRRRFRSLGE